MKRSEKGEIGFWELLIIALIVCGLFGVGPCAKSCQGCNPEKQTAENINN
jgi:hypothetical protein